MEYASAYNNPIAYLSEKKAPVVPRRRLRLHDFPMWKNMTAAEMEKMLRIMTIKGYKRGEILFNPLDEPNRLHLLQLGRVMTYNLTPQGQKKILHIFSPGDAFGALLLGAVDGRLPWAEAIEDVVICSMDESGFKEFMSGCPNMVLDLFKYMSEIHVDVMRRLQGLLHTTADYRVVMALLELGRRLGHQDDEEFNISSHFTHEDIANMIGVVRTTVSEAISQLRDSGIVSGSGRQLIVHRRRAEKYLQAVA